MRHGAGDQDLARRQLDLLQHAPLVVVARICRFERIGARLDREKEVDQVLELEIAHPRPEIHAVAGMEANALFGQPAQRMIEIADPAFHPFAIVGQGHGVPRVPGADQRRKVDLEQEPGVEDRLVLFAHRLAEGEEILIVTLVVFVLHARDRRGRRHEPFIGARRRHRRLQVADVALELLVADIADRADAHARRDPDRRRETGCASARSRRNPETSARRARPMPMGPVGTGSPPGGMRASNPRGARRHSAESSACRTRRRSRHRCRLRPAS